MRTAGRETEENGSRQKLLLDLSGVSVMVAMPTTRGLPAQTAISLIRAAHACWKAGIKIEVLIEPDISDVCLARSTCAHRFLTQSNASVLFWIDSDMTFTPDAFMRTVALTTKADVVFGSYAVKSEPLHFMMNIDGAFETNEYGCVVNSRGGPMGFSAVNRRVMQALADQSPSIKMLRGNLKEEPIRRIFTRHVTDDGYEMSEDVVFFEAIHALGFSIWCEPNTVLGHIGTKVYEGSLSEGMEKEDGIIDGLRALPRKEVEHGGPEGMDNHHYH